MERPSRRRDSVAMNHHDSTLLIQQSDEQRRAQARIRIRRKAYSIAAECELLMDEAMRTEKSNWSDVFGRVLIAVRKIIALTTPGSDATLFDDTLHPTRKLTDAQAEIMEAIRHVSPLAGAGEDSLLRGVHTI